MFPKGKGSRSQQEFDYVGFRVLKGPAVWGARPCRFNSSWAPSLRNVSEVATPPGAARTGLSRQLKSPRQSCDALECADLVPHAACRRDILCPWTNFTRSGCSPSSPPEQCLAALATPTSSPSPTPSPHPAATASISPPAKVATLVRSAAAPALRLLLLLLSAGRLDDLVRHP